jgi:hypothetical protein
MVLQSAGGVRSNAMRSSPPVDGDRRISGGNVLTGGSIKDTKPFTRAIHAAKSSLTTGRANLPPITPTLPPGCSQLNSQAKASNANKNVSRFDKNGDGFISREDAGPLIFEVMKIHASAKAKSAWSNFQNNIADATARLFSSSKSPEKNSEVKNNEESIVFSRDDFNNLAKEIGISPKLFDIGLQEVRRDKAQHPETLSLQEIMRFLEAHAQPLPVWDEKKKQPVYADGKPLFQKAHGTPVSWLLDPHDIPNRGTQETNLMRPTPEVLQLADKVLEYEQQHPERLIPKRGMHFDGCSVPPELYIPCGNKLFDNDNPAGGEHTWFSNKDIHTEFWQPKDRQKWVAVGHAAPCDGHDLHYQLPPPPGMSGQDYKKAIDALLWKDATGVCNAPNNDDATKASCIVSADGYYMGVRDASDADFLKDQREAQVRRQKEIRAANPSKPAQSQTTTNQPRAAQPTATMVPSANGNTNNDKSTASWQTANR